MLAMNPIQLATSAILLWPPTDNKGVDDEAFRQTGSVRKRVLNDGVIGSSAACFSVRSCSDFLCRKCLRPE
jgi:hypothetical protein